MGTGANRIGGPSNGPGPTPGGGGGTLKLGGGKPVDQKNK